jgi:hypothetical protein
MTTEVERRPKTGWGRRIMVSAMVTAFLAVAVLLTVRSGGRGELSGCQDADHSG